jgi:hypothetical protein
LAIESPTPAVKVDGPVAIVAHDASCLPTTSAPALVCSGALIAKNVVLTAAHCLDRSSASGLDVLSNGKLLRVRGGRAHPGFDPATHANDLAVLFLAADAITPPMVLRRTAMDLTAAEGGLRVVGFGNDAATEQQGIVTLAAVEPLQLKLLPGPSMTCRGDSGGPVLRPIGAGFELVGVTTHGEPTCRIDGYAARIDVHLPFIDAAVIEAALPEPARPPFDPGTNACTRSCSRDTECPAGFGCMSGRCALGGLVPSSFGSSCSAECAGEVPCVRIGSECRCARSCDDAPPPPPPEEDSSSGCAATRSGGSPWFGLGLVLLALFGRLRR